MDGSDDDPRGGKGVTRIYVTYFILGCIAYCGPAWGMIHGPMITKVSSQVYIKTTHTETTHSHRFHSHHRGCTGAHYRLTYIRRTAAAGEGERYAQCDRCEQHVSRHEHALHSKAPLPPRNMTPRD